ncbi:MAG: Nramp family divalent metal transporter, partial [Ketobacteraceae bacterium]|nr:Nramp family divalent metal transporter [Ketobacteraceae bacterium]
LAANALLPVLSINQWAFIHSVVAVIMVLYGRYSLFETMMKCFIALMFVTVIAAVIKLSPDWQWVAAGLVPGIPEGSLKLILGVIGGVGGSVTLLCYGYWMREKQWTTASDIPAMRVDLWSAYGITAVFGICILILAASARPELVKGSGILLALAHQLETLLGPFYRWLFLVGFWGAVFSSMLGVWQGVPYLFADFIQMLKQQTPPKDFRHTGAYRGFLVFLAIPPFSLLFYEKPVWLAITYAVAGAFFMPFLAATLLYMNNRQPWLNTARNRWWSNLLLGSALLLFVILMAQKLVA